MHRTFLLTTCILIGFLALVSVFGQAQGATIFDKRFGKFQNRPFRTIPLPNPAGHRHISSFAVPNLTEVERLREVMQERFRKYNDEEDSNERNLWRSHPVNQNFESPDTTEAVGMKF